ncbi:MAG: DUF6088 family protein [Sphingomonas oligoaromativorans]
MTDQIMAHVEGLPEGAGVSAKALLHLGNRAAVDQALSRLARRNRLVRAGRGLFLLPVHGRFGTRAPSIEEAIGAMAAKGGEVIVPSGAVAANRLGLTTRMAAVKARLAPGDFSELVAVAPQLPSWFARCVTTFAMADADQR